MFKIYNLLVNHMNITFYSFLLTFIAGFSTMLGTLLIFFKTKTNKIIAIVNPTSACTQSVKVFAATRSISFSSSVDRYFG